MILTGNFIKPIKIIWIYHNCLWSTIFCDTDRLKGNIMALGKKWLLTPGNYQPAQAGLLHCNVGATIYFIYFLIILLYSEILVRFFYRMCIKLN